MKNLAKTIIGATIGLAYGIIIFPVFLLIFYNEGGKNDRERVYQTTRRYSRTGD